MPKYGAQIDTQRIPIKGMMAEPAVTGSAPATPPEGLFWHDTTLKVIKVWLDGQWKTLGEAGAGGPPSGSAGGDLAGSTYPNPTIANGVVTSIKIADSTIVDGDVAAANKDGVAGTASMRTLGTGATQAAAGNHTHALDANVSDGDKGEITVTSGVWSIDNLVVTAAKIANATITDTQVAASNKDGADATASLRTLGYTSGKAMPGVARLDQIAVPTASVALNSQKITGLADGTAATDAVNKSQLDTAIQGLDAKQSVRLASTANLGLTGLAAIDGVTPIANDRILVKNQTTTSQNGIYVAAAGAWTRATDMDTWAEVPDAFTWVEQGSLNADTGWVCTTVAGGVINTNPITWTQFSGAGQISAGAGMTKTGSQLDVGAGTGISVAADSVAVDTGVIATVASLANYVPTTRTITPTAPLTGGGALSSNLALDISNFTTTVKGAVPPPTTVTGKFLKDDGTWAAPVASTRITMPALAAGTWVTPTPAQSHRSICKFIETSSPFQEVVLDVRENPGVAGELQVKADIAYGAGALNATFVG